MTLARIPAERYDPRRYVSEELEARRLPLGALPSPAWDWFVDPGAPLTPEIADALAVLFGTSAELWSNLEDAWQTR